MISQLSIQHVHLALGATDLRKSIDGLALIVSHVLKMDPFSTHLFAFCNKRRNLIKILVWDHNGFWIHYKRLENGSFQWPESGHDRSLSISERSFRWLLDGMSVEQKTAHTETTGRIMI
jgi:Transposase and inactivated derivatives